MASSTRREKILTSISPAALVAIVLMNLFLIYLMFETLENQTRILQDIEENTEIALTNQEIGLNVSAVNQDLITRVLDIQQAANETLRDLNAHAHQINNTLSNLP